jgi:hypothetical protein
MNLKFKPFTVKLLTTKLDESEWTVRSRKMRKYDGLTVHSSNEILISSPEELLELIGIAVHEAAHAAVPDLEEDAILRIEHNAIKVLGPILHQLEVLDEPG